MDDDAALTCVGDNAKGALGAIAQFAKQFEADRRKLGAAGSILERLEALEQSDRDKGARLDKLETKLDSLSHNLSGFTDNAARLAAEAEERAKYKEMLAERAVVGADKIEAGAAAAKEQATLRRTAPADPVDLGFGLREDGSPRRPDAMKRWFWAVRQIKIKMTLARLGADVRCAPRNSVAERLAAMAAVIGDLTNRIEYYEKENPAVVPEDHGEAVARFAGEMSALAYRLDGHDDRVGGLGERVDALGEQVRAVNGKVEQLQGDVAASIGGFDALQQAQAARGAPKDISEHLGTLEGLARDAVPEAQTWVPLAAFVSDLVGAGALSDGAAEIDKDAALYATPTVCDPASAPRVERLAWACYRLLDDGEVQAFLETYEGARTAVRGPFGKTLRCVYDALLNALETVTSPAAVKLDVRALESRAACIGDVRALESDAKMGMDAISEDVRALESRLNTRPAERPRTAGRSRPSTPGANAAGDALVRKLDQVALLADDAQRRSMESLPRAAFEDYREAQLREAEMRAQKKRDEAERRERKRQRKALKAAEAAAAAAAADDASFATQESAPAGYLLAPKPKVSRRPKTPQALFDELYEPVRALTPEEAQARQRALMVKILGRMANFYIWRAWACWADAVQRARAAAARRDKEAEAERARLEAERTRLEIEQLKRAGEGAEADRLAAAADRAREEAERREAARRDAERREAARRDAERLAAEQAEAARLAAEQEVARLATEQAEMHQTMLEMPSVCTFDSGTDVLGMPSVDSGTDMLGMPSVDSGTDTLDLVEKYRGPPGASRDELKAVQAKLASVDEAVRRRLGAVDDALAGLAASSSDVGHQVPQMRHALTLLGQQLASLQSAKADRARTEKELRKKVDREEIDRIAAQLAGGKDDELDPTLMAKRQVPAMKCLSCDRPLALGLRTEAGIFPPQAYEGAAPATTQIESLGRGPSSLDALYASGARPRSAQMPLLRPPPGTSQNLRARWPPLNGWRRR